MKKKKITGIASLLSAAFIYGFFGILTRMVGFSLPIFYLAWIRNLFCALLILIPLLLSRVWLKVEKKDYHWLILRAIGGILGFLGSYAAFYYLNISTAYFIFYTGMLVTSYFFGLVLYKDRLTNIKIVSFVLAIIGLTMIYQLSMDIKSPIYDLFAFISGFGTSTWNTFSKKISGKYSVLQLNFLDFFISFVINIVISLAIREHWVMPSLNRVWLGNLLFVFMFITTGQLMIVGFKYIDTHIGSLIMLSELIFGIILSMIFYQEKLTLFALIGGIIIVIAIILPEIKYTKDKKN